MMAQAGLRIPAADGSRVPVFRSLFADIGDEQSIEASLSTFSAHVTNIASMDRGLVPPALVLLDEVGFGNRSDRGRRAGRRVVDHFKPRGATVIATSHYDALKTYASTTDGVASAAFGFDAETFAPTYQLLYGSPGRSLALEIAARLGLSPSVVAAARAEPERARSAARRASGEDRPRHARARARTAAGGARTGDARGRRSAHAPARGRAEAARRNVQTPAERRARDAGPPGAPRNRRRDRRAERRRRPRLRASRGAAAVTTGETGAARSDARAAVDAVCNASSSRREPRSGAAAAAGNAPAVGDRVIVGGLGLEAIVTAVHDGSADLDVRGKRMRASLRDLRVVAARRGAGAASASTSSCSRARRRRRT